MKLAETDKAELDALPGILELNNLRREANKDVATLAILSVMPLRLLGEAFEFVDRLCAIPLEQLKAFSDAAGIGDQLADLTLRKVRMQTIVAELRRNGERANV